MISYFYKHYQKDNKFHIPKVSAKPPSKNILKKQQKNLHR